MRANGKRSGAVEADGKISLGEVNAFRDEVANELRTEEENLSLIDRHDERARKLVPLLLGLLVINVLLFFILPHYPIYWIVAGFFVYMYYFIVLLFPTTRRVRTPAEKKEGVKARRKKVWGQGARGAITRGKKAVTIAFWNSFFIGTQTLARGITLVLAISIAFAAIALTLGTLDPSSAAIVVVQSAAIIGYYYVIIRFRPYSKDFLQMVGRVRRGRSRGQRWQAYLRGLFVILILLTVFVVLIISAIFLPKRSLDAILLNIGADYAPVILGIIVIFASQFILIRYVQGFDSARTTTQFIGSKMSFLDQVLGELKVEGVKEAEWFQAARAKFRVSRIYKVAYKDIFGVLPTYPIIVDFRSVLEKDVADSLDTEIPIDIPSGGAT
jgi:hypothetical protein